MHLRAAAHLLLAGWIGMVWLATGGTFPVMLIATLVAFGLGTARAGAPRGVGDSSLEPGRCYQLHADRARS